jgi:hypothetical protein
MPPWTSLALGGLEEGEKESPLAADEVREEEDDMTERGVKE